MQTIQLATMAFGALGILVGIVSVLFYLPKKNISTKNDISHTWHNDDTSFNESSDENIGYVNPASGALMVDGMDSIDTFGNSYGSDISGSFCDEIGEK